MTADQRVLLAAELDAQLTEDERAKVVESCRLRGHQKPDGSVGAAPFILTARETLSRRLTTARE